MYTCNVCMPQGADNVMMPLLSPNTKYIKETQMDLDVFATEVRRMCMRADGFAV